MLSVAGGEVAFVALMALVFGRTHSAIWGSAALLAVIGTYGLAAPFAGMLGDRFDRRIVMICSDAAGAVVNLALVFVARPDGADRARRAGRDRAVAVSLVLAGGHPEPRAAGRARVGERRALARQQPRLHARPGRRRRARRDRRRLVRVRVQRGRPGGLGRARLERHRLVQREDGREAARRPRRGLRVPLERPRAALDHGRVGPDPGRRRRAARVRVPARRAVRRGLARLRPADQLVGRRHAARLGVRRARASSAPRTGRSSRARSASRSCSAASRSRRSSGSSA